MDNNIPPEFDPRTQWHIPLSSSLEEILLAATQELKSPVNSIKGSMLLLESEAAEAVRPRAYEIISNSTKRIEWLIETIRAYLEIRPEILRESIKDTTPTEKLAAIRSLMLGPIGIVRENVTIMRINFEHQSISQEDLAIWIEKIDKANDEIAKILDELTL